MRKEYHNITKYFEEIDNDVIIDACEKEKTLQCIRVRKFASENMMRTRWQIVKSQLHYMDKSILWIHLMTCLGAILFVWTKWYDLQNWEKYSMILAGVLGALSVLEVGGMFFSGTTELESSCYFNVRQLAAFQMTYSGILSLAALLISTVFANMRLEKNIIAAGIYILVPFVSTECVCLTIMLTEIGRRNILLLIAAGAFSAFFWGIMTSIPALYETSAMIFWIGVLLIGIGIFALQIKWFFNALDKGEIVCAD